MTAGPGLVDLQRRLLAGYERLMTPAEVSALMRVDPKTVTRWAKAGKLSSVRTVGGHRRFLESEINALLEGRFPDTSKVLTE